MGASHNRGFQSIPNVNKIYLHNNIDLRCRLELFKMKIARTRLNRNGNGMGQTQGGGIISYPPPKGITRVGGAYGEV